MIDKIKKNISSIINGLMLIAAFVGAFSFLATKSDIERIQKINSFQWAESSIKINELQLSAFDKIKEFRALTPSELREYNSILKSSARIEEMQEKLLNDTNIIN